MAEERIKNDFLDQFDEPMTQAFAWLWKNKYIQGVKCPVCANEDWLFETRDITSDGSAKIATPTFVLRDARGHWGVAPSIPAIMLSCTKCGFIRQHNLAILADQVARDKPNE